MEAAPPPPAPAAPDPDTLPTAADTDPAIRTIDWTEALDGPSDGLLARNWILPAAYSDFAPWPRTRPDYVTYPAWTVFDQTGSATQAVTPYESDEVPWLPAFRWPVEIESGALAPTPRHPDTRTIRYYVDAAARAWSRANLARAELVDRAPLGDFGWREGSSLWFGWSDCWMTLDDGAPTTVLQFRNQPTADDLERQGIRVDAAAAAAGIARSVLDANVNGTGPCVQLLTVPVDGRLHWRVEIRRGTIALDRPLTWTLPADQAYTSPDPIEPGTWYDAVIRLRSSQGGDGSFALWIRRVVAGAQVSPMQADRPDWSFRGPTEYQYPVVQGIAVRPVPELRKGIYRWDRRPGIGSRPMTPGSADPNRYMVLFEGPRRYWIGETDDGLAKVNPRQRPTGTTSSVHGPPRAVTSAARPAAPAGAAAGSRSS